VFNLIRRKNSKDVIIHALFEMIRSNYSIKILKIIFNKIVKHLQKNLYNKKALARGSSMIVGNDAVHEDKKNSYDLTNPQVNLLITLFNSISCY
jgi:hypothetical protein